MGAALGGQQALRLGSLDPASGQAPPGSKVAEDRQHTHPPPPFLPQGLQRGLAGCRGEKEEEDDAGPGEEATPLAYSASASGLMA